MREMWRDMRQRSTQRSGPDGGRAHAHIVWGGIESPSSGSGTDSNRSGLSASQIGEKTSPVPSESGSVAFYSSEGCTDSNHKSDAPTLLTAASGMQNMLIPLAAPTGSNAGYPMCAAPAPQKSVLQRMTRPHTEGALSASQPSRHMQPPRGFPMQQASYSWCAEEAAVAPGPRMAKYDNGRAVHSGQLRMPPSWPGSAWGAAAPRPSGQMESQAFAVLAEAAHSISETPAIGSTATASTKKERPRPPKSKRQQGRLLAERIFKAQGGSPYEQECAERQFIEETEGDELLSEYASKVLKCLRTEASQRQANGEDASMTQAHINRGLPQGHAPQPHQLPTSSWLQFQIADGRQHQPDIATARTTTMGYGRRLVSSPQSIRQPMQNF